MFSLKFKSHFTKPNIIHKEYIPAKDVYDLIQRQKLKHKVKTFCLDNIKEELQEELTEELKNKYKEFYIKKFEINFKNLYLLEVRGEIYTK